MSINLDGVFYDGDTGAIAGPAVQWVGLDANGYLVVRIHGERRYAHQIAWAYVYGDVEHPFEIDHINGKRADNRIANLRAVTVSDNLRNRPAFKTSKTGYKCIFKLKNGYFRVELKKAKKYLFRKQFRTMKDAIKARNAAMIAHGYPMERIHVD